MKFSKELKTGGIAIIAIALLVAGINFLKGNSFFGGDDTYYVYLPESGGITGGTSVYVKGVIVGKVTNIALSGLTDDEKKVVVTFNIQDRNFKIPKNSTLSIGNADFLSKGIIITPNEKSTEYYRPKEYIQGQLGDGMFAELRDISDPLMQKLQVLASTLNSFVESLSTYWDTTANIQLNATFQGVQRSLRNFDLIASQIDDLMVSEQHKLSKIFSNVESITTNLNKSNREIVGILGNVETFTNDLAKANVQATIQDAHTAIAKFNSALDNAIKGEGTLGKLIADDQLYKELNQTNQQLQDLLEDVEKHPERYIRVSVFGGKIKGTNLSAADERKLKKLLDSLPPVKD